MRRRLTAHCNTLQRTETHCNILQHTLQHTVHVEFSRRTRITRPCRPSTWQTLDLPREAAADPLPFLLVSTLQHTATNCHISQHNGFTSTVSYLGRQWPSHWHRIYIYLYTCKIYIHIYTYISTHIRATHQYTLHHTATHCNTLQHTATHCNTPIHTSSHCNTLSALLRTSTHCSGKHFQKSEHTATHCNTLQHTATHCITLQHTATHCNTLCN